MLVIKKQFLPFFLSVIYSLGIAQTTGPEATATAVWSMSCKLTSETPHAVWPFLVDASSSMVFSLTAKSTNIIVTLVSPDGTRFQVGQSCPFGVSSIIIPNGDDPSGNACNYLMIVPNPMVGSWTLDLVQSPVPTSASAVLASIHFESQVVSALIGGGKSITVGSPVAISLVTMDGGTKLKGVTVTGVYRNISNSNDPGSAMSFNDDGSGADYSAGDGIYTCFIGSLQSGDYVVQARVDGTGSTGAFQRMVNTCFNVVPKTATITGVFNERIIIGGPK